VIIAFDAMDLIPTIDTCFTGDFDIIIGSITDSAIVVISEWRESTIGGSDKGMQEVDVDARDTFIFSKLKVFS
jgi:hypothetical protein